ncbi:MAG: AraC family transcriptional regulator [Dysgonamonadaceae bacterium]|jgi:AraC-like DNA-binding protein|nr:AraC family transcriptional regulator [Dysgonamonadaceae bacterium]
MNEYNELLNGSFCLSRVGNEIPESPAIEIIDYEEGVSANKTAKDAMLFFVMEGAINATYGFAENRLIEANHFFLIPPLASYNFSFTKNTKLYCCHMTEEIFLCRKDKPELLSEVCERMKLVDQDSDLFTVESNSNIINVLNSSSANIKLGLQWPDYQRTIIQELQILISAYYSDEDLAHLFHSIFKGDIVFKAIVLQNRNKLSTVEEFAAAVHLNRNSFRKRFTDIFGINPSDWIISNRAEQVINELKKDKPIANIVHNCSFSSYPNFVRFCRNFLQNTPAALRKQIRSMENPDVYKFLKQK